MTTIHKTRVRKHFDDWAGHYDERYTTRWFRTFQNKVIEQIAPQPNQAILDVGCGTGWAVAEIGHRAPKTKVCGIDLSPEMIRLAERKRDGAKNIEFKVGDAENIPYPDGTFDVIMCTSSFHHYPSPLNALEEFKRVLKKSGRIYLLDTCRDSFPLVVLYDLFQKYVQRDHVRYYSTKEIKKFFEDSNLQNIREVFRVQGFFKYGKFLTSQVLITATNS